MKLIFVFLTLLILTGSCKKIENNQLFYYVEDFRKSGMDDYQTIMAACNSLPENSNLVFDNKTYIIGHTPIIHKSLNFYGPATFKRENQITYTLKEPANEFSTYLILNSTNGLINLDRIELCTNNNITGATAINAILGINQDTIFLAIPVGRTTSGTDYYPAGTTLFKSINFFWVLSSLTYTDMSCSFNNLTFDGNRDNNKGTYYWDINAAITAISKGLTTYRNCVFINSPNETIVGHNADISNCTFYDLNGSAFHTVADKLFCTESEIHSKLTDNIFENTNEISTTITGHSEGAITDSESGGYYNATDNTFINVGESVLGGLEPGITVNDWGTSDISFTGNIINGAGRMVYMIDTLDKGTIHDVRIEKNIISNLQGRDWSAELKYWPDIILENQNEE
jgi:hypothetical protein